MTKSSFRALSLTGSMCLFAVTASPAVALNIVLNPDAGLLGQNNGAAALAGFQKAANFWNKTLTNNVTVNVKVSMAAMAPNTLGGTGNNTAVVKARDFYAALAATGTSALDKVAVANLKPLSAAGGIAYRLPAQNAAGLFDLAAFSILDNNDTRNNTDILSNTATLKALGLGYALDSSLYKSNLDANMVLNSAFAFDYDPSDGITVGQADFLGTAIHEMGHALGFFSGTDAYDIFSGKGPYGMLPLGELAEDQAWLRPLDLFRYGAANPNANGGYDLQLTPGRAAFFSVDGRTPFLEGRPDLGEDSYFSTGTFNGDGLQASHWRENATTRTMPNGCTYTSRQVGVMDPTLALCRTDIVTATDLAAFDAIGWNLTMDVLANRGYTIDTKAIWAMPGLANLATALPEPATWAEMLLGFGLVGTGLRRRGGRRVAA